MKYALVWLITAGLIFLPCNSLLHAMPIASQAPSAPETAGTPVYGGGHSYYYYEGSPVMVFLETALYIGLIVGALIILDEHLENVTIIIYD